MLILIAVLLFLILLALPGGMKIVANLVIACILLSFFASFALHHDQANDRSAWHSPPCTHGCDP
jgi:hypothetical protein